MIKENTHHFFLKLLMGQPLLYMKVYDVKFTSSFILNTFFSKNMKG